MSKAFGSSRTHGHEATARLHGGQSPLRLLSRADDPGGFTTLQGPSQSQKLLGQGRLQEEPVLEASSPGALAAVHGVCHEVGQVVTRLWKYGTVRGRGRPQDAVMLSAVRLLASTGRLAEGLEVATDGCGRRVQNATSEATRRSDTNGPRRGSPSDDPRDDGVQLVVVERSERAVRRKPRSISPPEVFDGFPRTHADRLRRG